VEYTDHFSKKAGTEKEINATSFNDYLDIEKWWPERYFDPVGR
jgi:hypothetical protein